MHGCSWTTGNRSSDGEAVGHGAGLQPDGTAPLFKNLTFDWRITRAYCRLRVEGAKMSIRTRLNMVLIVTMLVAIALTCIWSYVVVQ